MKCVLHIPFGSFGEESGALCLLSRYLTGLKHELVVLRCNGVFSLCDRDEDTNWQRRLDSCFRCSTEQQVMADWSEGKVVDLSSFLEPADITFTKEWLSRLDVNNLCEATFAHPLVGAVTPFAQCKASFRRRFGTEVPDLKNGLQEQVLRRLLLSAARMNLAGSRAVPGLAADLYLVSRGKDFISSSLIVELLKKKQPVSIFEWQSERRCVEISHPHRDDSLDCGIILESIHSMRADCKTWPPELERMVETVVRFLGLEAQQMALAPTA